MKKGYRQYGQLASRIAISAPWEEEHVDCIGNWKFKVLRNVEINIRELTMIYQVINLLEITKLTKTTTTYSVM